MGNPSTSVSQFEEIQIPGPFHRLFPTFLDAPLCVLLDSGMAHDRLGRYSYITADPFLVVKSAGRSVEIQEGRRTCHLEGDPFRELQSQLRRFQQERLPGIPPFQGGAAGYFAYELRHHVEDLTALARDDLGNPEMYVGLYDWTLAHDHTTGRTWIVSTGLPEGEPERARERVAWVRARLEGGVVPVTPGAPAGNRPDLASNFTRESYMAAVRRVKEYIAAGDIYQANISQRFQAGLAISPWQLYERLRRVNPAPFAAYIGFDGLTVVSASPEEFLRLDGRLVETRPIKGTRPRGATPEADRELGKELLASAKDRAENVMIVDLLRNDIGRVCRIGSVRVPELVILEKYPTVFHLVSTVVGELRQEHDAVDLLRACFPGGSITGAPKIRSMEIIDELEPTRRSVYCGSIGYVSFTGDANTSIVIRTFIVKNGSAYFQVGGGIVADSDPAAEYQETLDKARALMMALEIA